MGLTINFIDQEKGVSLPEAYIRIMNYTSQHKISLYFSIGIFANKTALAPYATREFYVNKDQQLPDPDQANLNPDTNQTQADMKFPYQDYFSLEKLSAEGMNPEEAIYRYLKEFHFRDAQDVFETGQADSPPQEESQSSEAQ